MRSGHGLDTAAWGERLRRTERLPDLLRSVARVPGEFRVRVGMMSPQSLEPHRDAYFDALAQAPAYRFLHLPLQSGSDRILDGMRRGHHTDLFRCQVDAARRRLPDLHLATDVIVGFPGETEDDFRSTEELLEVLGPETVNVTRFSARPGTPAARLPPLAPRVAKRTFPLDRPPAPADLEDSSRAVDRNARPGSGPGARTRRQLRGSPRELLARGPRHPPSTRFGRGAPGGRREVDLSSGQNGGRVLNTRPYPISTAQPLPGRAATKEDPVSSLTNTEIIALVFVVVLAVIVIGLFVYLIRRLRSRRAKLLSDLADRPQLNQDRAFNRLGHGPVARRASWPPKAWTCAGPRSSSRNPKAPSTPANTTRPTGSPNRRTKLS